MCHVVDFLLVVLKIYAFNIPNIHVADITVFNTVIMPHNIESTKWQGYFNYHCYHCHRYCYETEQDHRIHYCRITEHQRRIESSYHQIAVSVVLPINSRIFELQNHHCIAIIQSFVQQSHRIQLHNSLTASNYTAVSLHQITQQSHRPHSSHQITQQSHRPHSPYPIAQQSHRPHSIAQ